MNSNTLPTIKEFCALYDTAEIRGPLSSTRLFQAGGLFGKKFAVSAGLVAGDDVTQSAGFSGSLGAKPVHAAKHSALPWIICRPSLGGATMLTREGHSVLLFNWIAGMPALGMSWGMCKLYLLAEMLQREIESDTLMGGMKKTLTQIGHKNSVTTNPKHYDHI